MMFDYKKVIKIFVITLIVLNIFFVFPIACEAAGQETVKTHQIDKPKVLMLIINRVSVDDITNGSFKNINKLLSKGSFGLMTINSAGGISDSNSYVSLGGGDRLAADGQLGEVYNNDEKCREGTRAAEIYKRNTGISPGKYKILNVSIAATLNKNSKNFSLSLPGELGTVLQQNGFKTAVIGNSDLGFMDPPNRLAAAIAMDELGRVNYGDVSRNLLKKDSSYPYGWRTDYDKILSVLDSVWEKSDLIVVETGDSLRANEISAEQTKKMKEFHRYNALKAADGFIGKILPKINENVLFMLVTPLPYNQLVKDGGRVSPVLMAGGMVEKGGILSSYSTRQAGLISNYDISATILRFLGIPKKESMIGLPVSSLKESKIKNIAIIKEMYDTLTVSSQNRNGILYVFSRYSWFVMGFMFIMIISGNIKTKFFQRVRRYLLTEILILPLVVLILAAISNVNFYVNFAVFLVLSVFFAYGLAKIEKNLTLYVITALFMVITCIVDVLTGCSLMKKAALSYDLMAGGRFYGIGNEYMGVVIGAAIMGISSWIQQKAKPGIKNFFISGIIFGSLVVFFAAPFAGTNAGGALAALVGFICALYLYSGRKISLRSAAVLSGSLIFGIGVLITINMATPVSSHIGRSLDYLMVGDINAIWQIIQRKLIANIYLLKHSPFSILLVFQLAVLGGLVIKELNLITELAKQEPYMSAGFFSIFIGSLAAFAFNDSGVIAAALMLNYLVVPLLMQLSQQPEREQKC